MAANCRHTCHQQARHLDVQAIAIARCVWVTQHRGVKIFNPQIAAGVQARVSRAHQILRLAGVHEYRRSVNQVKWAIRQSLLYVTGYKLHILQAQCGCLAPRHRNRLLILVNAD